MRMDLRFLQGIRHGMPICLGYFSIAIAFGIQAVNIGLFPVQAWMMSMGIFAGAGQFALLLLLASGAGVLEATLTIFVVNLRYALLSFSLAQRLADHIPTGIRALMGFGLTDEVYAVAVVQPERVNAAYYAGLALISYLGWNAGTLLGATLGQLLPEVLRRALSISIYAMFLAIVVPPMRQEKPMAVAVLLAMGFSVLLYLLPKPAFLTGGVSVLLAALVAAGIAAWLFPAKEGTA